MDAFIYISGEQALSDLEDGENLLPEIEMAFVGS